MCSVEIFSEVVMTFISRKTRLLLPHIGDECDRQYLYQIHRKRSDGRLKRYSSCDDLRAWVDDEYLNYQYLLEMMTDGEFQERPFLGVIGRFVPVDVILDIFCGKASEGRDTHTGWVSEREGALAKQGNKGEDTHTEQVNKATENLLKITRAAMTKLETVRDIVGIERCNDVDKEDVSDTGKECVRRMSMSAVNNSDMDENEVEYRSTLTKIACLKQRLHSIQECREELNAKIRLSRQKMCQQGSSMAVTELYNREEQSNMKRLQKKIEKLIAEKGQVLEEMCRSLKYLNELKKNVNLERKQNGGCSYPCSKAEDKYNEKLTQVEHSVDGHVEDEWKGVIFSTPKSNKFGRGHQQEMYRNCAHYPQSETQSTIKDSSSQDSSDTTFKSMETIPVSDSLNMYKMPPVHKKFKSETSMMEVEQTLRSFEQRLRELSCLEPAIEDLKKRAGMVEHFKRRWLKSMVRNRTQKTTVEEMKREMEELYRENCQFKQAMQKITAESEKKHIEMQRLRCKAMKLVGMKQEMMKLKNEIKDYQLSCESQNECIGRLENTVREQREEIDRLMIHMARLCRVTEKLREVKRPVKKNFPRSRSYGPDRQNPTRSVTAPEKDMEHVPCCRCNRRNCNVDTLNRPKSECGRRMPDQCCVSLAKQETYRDSFCNH